MQQIGLLHRGILTEATKVTKLMPEENNRAPSIRMSQKDMAAFLPDWKKPNLF
jgi:hypothetical protein